MPCHQGRCRRKQRKKKDYEPANVAQPAIPETNAVEAELREPRQGSDDKSAAIATVATQQPPERLVSILSDVPKLPSDPWDPGIRATDVPVEVADVNPRFPPADLSPVGKERDPDPVEIPRSGSTPTDTSLHPNKADILRHLFQLFSPAFVRDHPDAQIEIAYADLRGSEKPDKAERFSVFKLDEAADFAELKSKAGCNVYVGPALRKGGTTGRASSADVVTSSRAWADFDKQGDEARVHVLLKEKNLQPTEVVQTGSTPHPRFQIYLKLAGKVTPQDLGDLNAAVEKLLDGDNVKSPANLMRLAGTINYPTPKKAERGYIPELVTLDIRKNATAYTVEHLISLAGKPSDAAGFNTRSGRNDDELEALLEASRIKNWHNNIRAAIATMIGRGWSDSAIRQACKPYCRDGSGDHDLDDLIDRARKKWKTVDEESAAPGASIESDLDRLNKVHAVLPIGGKTRVVTFGELEEFPGRETIVMTQTIADFKALQNKYRHTYRDKKGELRSEPLGTYWIDSPERRQYDGGMAFTPQHDGDVGTRLNLFRGFGVEPIKPDGKVSAAEGCAKVLAFMLVIICSGNEEHFQYLLKREATIFQKRIRTEVALGFHTKEEGCGKGFYEAVMGHLLGTHAMQLGNPEHIIGKFNPHLETLLRVTADEALFVGDPKHRNALFGLITEPTLTIEPKGCGIYTAPSYLNLSVTSNAEHFLPVSDTARRFFIPSVSAARKQDHDYFAGLQAELDNGGYQALLYHLLFEVDLAGFNVRKVPQTEGLRQQRDLGLPPLDAWWCELLETGTLWGSDPKEPHRAVSNGYTRTEKIETESLYGGTQTQIRQVKQLGLFDQARQIEPRLRTYTNDHQLGGFLSTMGCDSEKKVMRRRGWTFPPIVELSGKSVIPAGDGATRKSLNGSLRNRTRRSKQWKARRWKTRGWILARGLTAR